MILLTDQQKAEYFRRSFISADGLWFMKVEQLRGFDEALVLDDEVWKVMPKIQARMLKSLSGLGNGLDALYECITTKLSVEGFNFDVERCDNEFILLVRSCPWHALRVRAGREPISGIIGDRICRPEYQVWADEFHDDILFEQGVQICKGARACALIFTRNARSRETQ